MKKKPLARELHAIYQGGLERKRVSIMPCDNSISEVNTRFPGTTVKWYLKYVGEQKRFTEQCDPLREVCLDLRNESESATWMAFQAEGSMCDIWAMASGRVWKEQILQRGKEYEGSKSTGR